MRAIAIGGPGLFELRRLECQISLWPMNSRAVVSQVPNWLKNQALDAAYRSETQQRPEKLPTIPWFELIEMICGKDPLLCPKCKKTRLSMVAILPPKRAGPDDDLALITGFYHVA